MSVRLYPDEAPRVQYVDIGDGEPVAVHYSWRLDTLHEALAQTTTPGEVIEIEAGITRSLQHALKTRRIANGPAPFWRDAAAMCAARRAELAAQAAQASGGATVATARKA